MIRYVMSLLLIIFLTGCVNSPLPPKPTPQPLPSETGVPTLSAVAAPTDEPTATITITVTQLSTDVPTATAQPPVHGIILFIGDGMGEMQRLGGQWLAQGQNGRLAMDAMPVLGLASTSAANRVITDSAAAGTALAAGVKTNYLAVGVDVNNQPVPTILEQAKERGWSVGLITTVPLAHATPATFAAHVDGREKMTEIARQMIANNVDVMLGGGEEDFQPYDQVGCFPGNGKQRDGADPLGDALANGYHLVCSAQALLEVNTSETDKLIGFFGDKEIISPFSPNLALMTRVAIEILSKNPNGFFLMVEAGQIDWAGHDKEGLDAIQFTVGLNAAVIEAQNYALENPNTLIIVTADHETGGLSLNLDGEGSFRQDGPFSMPDGTPFWVDWEIGGHSPQDVPVTAQGPYSGLLAGIYPNTFIYDVMYTALTGE